MKRELFNLCLIAVFLVCAPFVLMAEDTEIQTNSIATNLGLYGGLPEDIAIDYDTDYVYIANMAPNGLFYSHDGGENWVGLADGTDLGTGKSVEVDQSNGDVYSLIGDSLVKSTDYGATFNDITSNTTDQNFGSALAVTNSQVLIGLNDGDVIYSSNSGETFIRAEIEADSTINFIAASPTADVFYATVEDSDDNDALYITEDGGAVWTNMDVHSKGVAADGRFYRVGADPSNADHLVLTSIIGDHPNYQTFDAGASWSALSNNGQEINSGYVAWDGNGRMYTSSLYTDDVTTDPIIWTQMDNLTPNSSLYYDVLAVDMEGEHVLYTDSGLGVAKSTDQGATWTDQIDGVTSVKSYAVSQASDKNIVWVGTRGGLARTANFLDDEPTWQYPILPDQSQSNWMGIWINPDDADQVVSGASDSIFYTNNGQDASPTWVEASMPSFDSMQVRQIIADPDDSAHLYSVLSYDNLDGDDTGAAVESTDSGATWTDMDFPLAGIAAIALTADKMIFVGITGDAQEAGLYMHDGSAWSKPTADFDELDITSILADPNDENKLYVTADDYPTGGGLYKSEDQGAAWTQITVDENINHADALTIQTSTDPDTIYMAGQDGGTLKGVIYKTSDAGESWGLLYTGLKHESFYTLLFDGLLAGNDRGLYEIKSKSALSLKANGKSKQNIAVKKGARVSLQSALKDITTDKVLKNKKIKLYRKVKNKRWKIYKTLTTNKNGVISDLVTINKLARFKVKWTPSAKNAEEYSGDVSRIIKLSIKRNNSARAVIQKDEKEGEELSVAQIEERIAAYYDAVGEIEVALQYIEDEDTIEQIQNILDKVEEKIVEIKKLLAEIDAGDEESLAEANEALDELKPKIVKAEKLLELDKEDKEDQELDEKSFNELLEKVNDKLQILGGEIIEMQEKLDNKEEKGKNVIAAQALLDEVKNSFYEAGNFTAQAEAAYAEGDMINASKYIYAAKKAVKVGLSLIDEIHLKVLKDKDEEGEELSTYDELIWKIQRIFEKIAGFRADAVGLSNEAKIDEELDAAETKLKSAYGEILAQGNNPEADWQAAEELIDAIKESLDSVEQMLGKGDMEELTEEQWLEKAENASAIAAKKYDNAAKKYQNKKDEMNDEQKALMKDLLDKLENDLNTADVYLQQGEYKIAYGYYKAVIIGAKIKTKLLKNI